VRLPIALVLALVLGVPRIAAAWSPGPFELERCVTDFDIAVRGTVTKVEPVATRGTGAVSRATIALERTYFGVAAGTKTLTFYFWSKPDNDLTLPHTLVAKQRVLVFLSANLDPLKGIALDGKTTLMLQFAKANHRGYLFTIDKDLLRDAIFHADPKLQRTLAVAEAALAKKQPPAASTP
jgi:hypothetical protein